MMTEYVYCPVLKTRPAEINAYELLNDIIKDKILPIIELTGAIGYTYPKNYKIVELRGTRRPGDINTKLQKIYDLMQKRRFILDITDDETLMYDGLSSSKGGLLDPSNGYEKWIDFLTHNDDFRKLVIPTIQFDTSKPREDIENQIKSLNKYFDVVSIKLPALVKTSDSFSTNIQFNPVIKLVLDFISSFISLEKLILILDFGYINNFEETKRIIEGNIKDLNDLQKLKAIIPVSSCFPNFVSKVSHPITISETNVYELVKNHSTSNTVVYGDFASLHPVKYDMGGGGWIPRIDYIVANSEGKPIEYEYKRGVKRNTSSEYFMLAQEVIASPKYHPISEVITEGDIRIQKKALGDIEGKSPSYWIATRANLYMTMQCLYFMKNKCSYLSL